MSLSDQQWCPTSVQVTVLQARGLRIKGKGGTNDAYAVMQVGKEKYQTSVVEKCVAPVWKEEAAFDLPQLQQAGGGGGGGGGTERSTLHVSVLHRALVGPDKLLGQAVINLLLLSEDKTRNKTEWFKLLDKTGKADKDRGEVLVDIQFMRNNMTASMFDLSAAGKSRSRLGKFKDKVRGKKKESDTSSTIVPAFTQVLTDSEEEGHGDEEVAAGKDEKKKKHKMKSLFSPKSNLQKNMSQSMSVLPGKNSSLSGSQSSGLNVDSSEGKKKFKFKIHKRSGSSDNKESGHQKQGAAEQSNLCINGSHIYCEEPPPRTSRIGSNFSLASSGHGSMEDVPESSPPSVDSLRAVRQYSPWTEEEEETAEKENIKEDEDELRREEEERVRMEEERKRKEEEEERVRMEEERRRKEEEEERVRRQEEEAERLAEEKRRLEEEEEERRRIEEEEKRQREEEERIRMEEEMARRREEERKLAEEKRRLEEERRIEEERVRKEEEERIQREEEERRRREEEERVRREEEERERLAEEKRLEEEARRMEEEEKRQREEEERIRMEEERAEKERRRREEEERARREEEERERLAEEKRRLAEEEERSRIEEEEKRQREEEERLRMEEERETERRRQEEEYKLAEEKRRLEEEEKVRKQEEEERIRREEERRRQEEEEMLRRQEEERAEKRRLEEQERREEEERIRKEEEEKAKREKEEYERLLEEKRKREEEERKRKEEEEKIRKEEEERERRRREEEEENIRRQLAAEKRILEEQERRRIEEEEKKQKEEEERIRKEEEEEKARKEKEENERLLEEKMRQEELKRRRIEEEERMRREEEERIRMEEERRRKQEEEQKRIIEEEERIKREKKAEEEVRKLEKEKAKRVAEEQKKDNKTKHKAAEVTSTNPFDENFSTNPFEESPDSPAETDSSTASTVRQRSQSAAASTDEKDLVHTQREKRLAPQPPGRNQAERHSRDGSARHLAQVNKQSKEKDVKTVNVPPQRSVQMIAPLSRSADAKNVQSLTQSSATKGTTSIAKNSKRLAPSRPGEEGTKTVLSSSGKTSNERGSEAKQKQVAYPLNPFEDDEDEDELTAQNNTTTTGSIQWPPAVSQAAASQAKIKSSKAARAPPLPATTAATSSTLMKQNTEGGHVTDDTGVTMCDNPSDPKNVQETPLQDSQPAVTLQSAGEEAGGRKEGPPTASRRLQPVKPLNPLGQQQSVSVVQGETDNKSTGIQSEVQKTAKVEDTGLKGPYSQLTREELISLVRKQETQLSERDKKISELEQYIDNLLVRVMEEKPSILMSMNPLK